MQRVAILTDNSAQFTRAKFPGDHLVFMLPTMLGLQPLPAGRGKISMQRFPRNPDWSFVDEHLEFMEKIFQEYTGMALITLSSALDTKHTLLHEAGKVFGDRPNFSMIDSHTTSVGLGLLVQMAAGLADSGCTLQEIEMKLRRMIPRIYTLFCLPNLSHLAAANLLSPAQAVVGEMLGLLPIYSLEDGTLTPVQKVRTHRHLLETFQEFVDEFDEPEYIGIFRDDHVLRTRAFREYLGIHFPRTKYDEFPLGSALAGMFGSQTMGLIVMDQPG